MRNLFKKGMSTAIALSMVGSMAVVIPVTVSAASEAVSGVWTNESEDAEGSGTWSYDGNGTLTISGSGTIPGSGPWINSDSGTAVTDPKDITKVVVTEGITGLGTGALRDYYAINTITLPASLKTIEHDAFRGINYDAFNDGVEIPKWTTLEIPAGVETISARPFEYSWGLASISVAAANKHFKSVDGVLFTNDMKTLVAYPAGKSNAAYTVPSSVKTFQAIYSNNRIQNLTIPGTVDTIKDWCIGQNTELTTLTIEDGVKTIEANNFWDLYKLEELVIPDSVTSCAQIYPRNSNNLKVLKLSKNADCTLRAYQTPSLVTLDMGAATFAGQNYANTTVSNAPNLETLILSDKETSTVLLDENAHLKTLDLGGSPALPKKNGGGGGTTDVSQLETLDLGTKMTTMPDLSNATNLETITIPSTIATVPSDALKNCTNLTDVTISDTTTVEDGAFSNCSNIETVNVVNQSGDAEQAAEVAAAVKAGSPSATVTTLTVPTGTYNASKAGMLRVEDVEGQKGATAFTATISGSVGRPTAADAFGTYKWAVTSGSKTNEFTFKQGQFMTLADTANAKVGLIVKGLDDDTATATLTVE